MGPFLVLFFIQYKMKIEDKLDFLSGILYFECYFNMFEEIFRPNLAMFGIKESVIDKTFEYELFRKLKSFIPAVL